MRQRSHLPERLPEMKVRAGEGCSGIRLAGLVMLVIASAWVLPIAASATQVAHLRQVEIRTRAAGTGIILKFNSSPPYQISSPSRRTARITFPQAESPLFRKLRRYNDKYIDGVTITQRGPVVSCTVSLRKEGTGIRIREVKEMNLVILEVGRSFRQVDSLPIRPERERIWSGAGRFIREFDLPVKTGLSFQPTDRQVLEKALDEKALKLFQAGEAMLYKGRGTEAEEIFSWLQQQGVPLRGLVSYRLGEARYRLQNYPAALQAFREGEKLLPEYLLQSPAITFAYADTVARSGSLAEARRILVRLISQTSDRHVATLLLTRLADIMARQGLEMQAVALYRNVTTLFPESAAAMQSAMRLADRRLFATNLAGYREVVADYQKIAAGSGDATLREEAQFKIALLESLYGAEKVALELVTQYEKRYPRGVYVTIVKSMREELLLPLYRVLYASQDYAGLVEMAQNNRDYLARCFTDSEFAARLAEAFSTVGVMKGELDLFSRLAEREWAAAAAPFLYNRVLDDAMALADLATSEKAAAAYLQRFPGQSGGAHVQEHLGWAGYMKGDMGQVKRALAWLQKTDSRPAWAESFYYLGKALAHEGGHVQAEGAMRRFIAEQEGRGGGSALLADAYFVTAASCGARGAFDQALTVCRRGLEIAAVDQRDQFLYKMGELEKGAGRRNLARQQWEQLVQEGRDQVWQKLAAQGLAELDWQERIARIGANKSNK